ncbi:YeeE/YedE family protein [Alcaligenaceae bacterium B3P038]|nr:YeeE/YedE family protein [Alcaligenaceae bacterium B3P038]
MFCWAQVLGNDGQEGRALAFSLIAGAAFGFVLQRSRFCFLCITRDFFDTRDARGLLGLVAALAVGTIGYHAVFGAFLPIPGEGRLPPGAHIGPVSWVLALGAFVFGIGMAVSGSCISAHLYRLGEGASASPFALLGAAGGFVLGFLSWNTLYASAISDAPVVWLPHYVGYGGSAVLQLGALAAVAALLLRRHRSQLSGRAAPVATGSYVDVDHEAYGARTAVSGIVQDSTRSNADAFSHPDRSMRTLLFGARWPTYVGGLLVGALSVVAYFRSGPLGVTAELGSLARTAAASVDLLPSRLQGLDTFAGCATVVKQAVFSPNGLFVIGLVLAAWSAALAANQCHLQRLRPAAVVRNLAGGLLMGWGAMVSLGCTVGVLLSGTMAGALSGWMFGVCCVGGIWVALRWRTVLGRPQPLAA